MAVTPASVSRIQDLESKRLELIRQRINDENYLNAAVQRLALVLSNGLMDITQEGERHERKRKRRK
jgi:hypothetical protein